jgi:hypothetical protein
LEFQQIGLEDRPIFDKSYRSCRHEGSESSFTNLFIWRKPLDIVWAQINNAVCVVVRQDGPVYALHPCAPAREDSVGAARLLAEWFAQQGHPLLIRGLELGLAEMLAEEFPEWTIEHDRPEDDYIYSVKELIELKGRRFEAKRHHIRTFLNNNPNYSYEAMNEKNALECIPVAKEWLERQQCDDRILQAELFAVEQALSQFNDLNLSGGIIRIEDRIKSFSVGEALCEDTVVIHIEKADPGVPGLYQMINREYLAHAWPDITYVNREEDMGIPGLRAAKQSYRPIRMVEKYRASGK